MHLSSCESPVYIRNRYTKEMLCVPCGKCTACLMNRQYSWVQRLELEQSYTPFTFMVYFDYDEISLPKYYLSQDRSFLYTDECSRLQPEIQLSELDFENQKDYDYLFSRARYNGLPACSVRDLQLLLKRINKYVKEKITGEYRNFRYFIVSEYGPNTFRPHYHGLFFIRSREFAECIHTVLFETWPYGHSDAKYVESTASRYVAQYLNCTTHLPSFYRTGLLKPFFLCSRRPPIGTDTLTSKEIQEIFYSATCERVVFKKTNCKLVSIPIGRALESRLFPKCFRFGSLSHSDRVLLYGLSGEEKFEAETFDLFKARLKGHCIDWKKNYGYYTASSSSPLVRLVVEVTNGFCVDSDGTLKSIYTISKRVLKQCSEFGVSLDYYVRQIERYWSDKDYFNLVHFYEFIEQYSLSHSFEECYLAYPFYNRDDPTFNRVELLKGTSDFKDMQAVNFAIFTNNTKTRDKNAYFEKLKSRDEKLFTIISNYYGR